MLRDGVCDEATNIEACFFDGGDCCLDRSKKDTTLCKTCTCKVTMDKDKLISTFKATKVMMFEDPVDFQGRVLATEKSVDDVLADEVCSAMCLDFSETVNAWKYNGLATTCTCSWLKSTECFMDNDLKEVTLSNASSNLLIGSYVQMTKLLDCSK